MSIYTGLASTALKLIKKYGTAITIVPKSTTYDPVDGTNSGASPNITGFGVYENYSDSALNETIQKGDLRVICNDLSTAPVPGDKIDSYQIVNVTTIKPDNSTVVIYELQVRN
jgi:hypothetical protein